MFTDARKLRATHQSFLSGELPLYQDYNTANRVLLKILTEASISISRSVSLAYPPPLEPSQLIAPWGNFVGDPICNVYDYDMG